MRNIAKTAITLAAALACAGALAGAAHADDAATPAESGKIPADSGKIQIKLLVSAVLPSGSVASVPNNAAGVVPTYVTQTTASNNVVPTVALEYFVTKNISVETICCASGHHVSVANSSTGTLAAGTTLVDNAQVIPATLTLKYHFAGLGPLRPYIGAGPSLFLWINDRPSATVQTLGVTRGKLSSNIGGAVQAGFDVPLGRHYALTLDAKKYFVKTDAHFDTATADVEDVQVNLNPWIVSAGVAYRF